MLEKPPSALKAPAAAELAFAPPEAFARARTAGDPLLAAALFAALARVNVLSMIARAGSGHIGSSFSSLDIVTWLHLSEMREGDVYFSSKGHDVPGLYAVLAGLGRLDPALLRRLRRDGGLPGHPDVGTPGIEANTGSLGMGISKAEGMVRAARLAGKDSRAFVLTGDGELQEGQIWESLGSAARANAEEITVIVDHNKIQSDTWIERVGALGDLEAKFRAFGWEVRRCDGHDFEGLSGAFADLGRVRGRPKALIADTVKGKGVSFMERFGPDERLYRFHSGAPDEPARAAAAAELTEAAEALFRAAGIPWANLETEAPPVRRPAAGERLVEAYARALVSEAERDGRLVVLDADLALDCGLLAFEERFPGRFIECGIAEQDMVSQAGGLALKGFLPVVHSFAAFLSGRANEQIYNNATEKTRVIYTACLAGLLPAAPGHSHQSLRDIGSLGNIPGLVLFQPADPGELRRALAWAVRENPHSTYLRLVSVPSELPFCVPEAPFRPGAGVHIRPGRDAVIIAYGPVMLGQAFEASRILEKRHGLGLGVMNLPWLNRVDAAWLSETVRGTRHLFTLDDHFVEGGQGERIAACAAESGIRVPLTRFGVRGMPACGTNDEALRAHGLDPESIASAIRHALL